MSVLRKYGAGLALVGRTLLVELFGKRLKTGASAPTNGQALVYSAADDAWSPGTVSGGSLPAGALGSILAYDGAAWAARVIGTNGHVLRVVSGEPQWSSLTAADVGAIAEPGTPTAGGVLAYASGSWQSTAAGTSRQVLTSSGTGAPSWGVDVLPLTQRAVDGLGTSVTTCAVLAHDLSGGGGGAGIGARCELQARNSASTLVAAAAVDGALTDATGGAEVGVLDVRVRSSGALARVARFASTGIRLDWAARSLTVLGFDGATELDVWRVDGSSRWAFGSTDATNCGGLRLYAPDTTDVAVYRGATAHWQIDSSGATIIGTTSHATTLRGSSLTIGLSSVVAVYQGGARVPRVTISASTTLDASHEVVHVDSTSGVITVTLPPPSEGRLIVVQRKRGANNVVVQRNASETIRTGGANVNSTTIADDARHSFIYDADSGEWSMEA